MFGDLLAARVSERESQVVLGLDPHPGTLWPAAVAAADAAGRTGERAVDATAGTGTRVAGGGEREDEGGGASDRGSPAQRAAAAVQAHCLALIDAAGPACVAVKPQLACFERLGAPGWGALERVVAHARDAGLLVIADGKRGDIAVTAEAYAQTLFDGLQTPFGRVAGLGVDMATVNPLMGADAVRPFVTGARARGGGVLVLVRTSNPGAADVEDLRLAGGGIAAGEAPDARAALTAAAGRTGAIATGGGRAAGEAVWERLARMVDELGRPGVGAGGVGDVGAVVGATAPGHLERARELMPRAVFLLPGVGAQGGRVTELSAAFAPGRAAGLVSASRSIALAHATRGGDPAQAARAEAEQLRSETWSLG